jgi:[acyl-carrier-protein] S-malonyltransferase
LFDSRPDLLGSGADEILGWALREVCLQGPEDRLTRTEYAQVALFAVSYALWEEFREVWGGQIAAGAGHSLGEYTSLCAAGVIDYPTALGVVARRGQAMAQAADLEPSGMAALIGADPEQAHEIASSRRSEGGRLEVANLNAPGQVVVAGGAEDIDWVVDRARDLGVKRAIPLKVSGAFHSSFMEPAAQEVARALEQVEFAEGTFPVWSNTTARPHRGTDLAATLASQVVSPVRFQESLEDMAASGVDTFIHIGPGDVTAGMVKRSLPEAGVHVVSEVDDIPGVADALVSVT